MKHPARPGYRHPLRDLACQIDLALQNSVAGNQARDIVKNCVDHLILLALKHERDHDELSEEIPRRRNRA